MEIQSFIQQFGSNLELVSNQNEKAIIDCTNVLSSSIKQAYEDQEGFEEFLEKLTADPLGLRIYVLMEKAEEEMESRYCGKVVDYAPPFAVDMQDIYEEEKEKTVEVLAMSILEDIAYR